MSYIQSLSISYKKNLFMYKLLWLQKKMDEREKEIAEKRFDGRWEKMCNSIAIAKILDIKNITLEDDLCVLHIWKKIFTYNIMRKGF